MFNINGTNRENQPNHKETDCGWNCIYMYY